MKDAPALLAAGAVHREDNLAIRRLRLDDEDKDLLPYLQLGGSFRLERIHLIGGDDTLRLGADIN